jgi:hypothetical protein
LLTFTTGVHLAGVTPEAVFAFMVSLDAETYRRWHPEHRDFAVRRGALDRSGSVMYFDENLGSIRLRGDWTTVEVTANKRVLFKARRLFPVYLELSIVPSVDGTDLKHRVRLGFKSRISAPLDALLKKMPFVKTLEKEIDRHAREEFKALAEILAKR